MRGILEVLQRSKEFNTIVDGVRKGLRQQLICGLSGAQRHYLLAALASEQTYSSLLVITPGEREAGALAEDLAGFLPGLSIKQFPAGGNLFHQVLAQSRETQAQRLQVLEGLCNGGQLVVLAPVEALLKRLIPTADFQGQVLRLSVGIRVDLTGITARLSVLGYERVDLVEERGQFALRGGILDVFPMTAHRPVRVEFFDDEVDSIRKFNTDNQRSEEKKNEVFIFPARELIVPDEQRWWQARQAINVEYQNQADRLSRAGKAEALQQLQELGGRILEDTGIYFSGMEQYLPFFYQETVTLPDYLPPGALVFIDDPVRTIEVVQNFSRERLAMNGDMLEKGRMLPGQFQNYIDWDTLAKALAEHPALCCSLLPRQDGWLKPQQTIHLPGKPIPSFLGKIEMLAKSVKEWRRAGYAVVFAVSSQQRSQQLLNALKEHQIDAFFAGSLQGHVRAGNVVITSGILTEGFELPLCRLAVVTEVNMFGQQKRVVKKEKKTAEQRMTPFVDLKAGDYVVHVNYGIGRYAGVVPLTIGSIMKEYLLVNFAGEDKLYVPVDQVGLIQKYLGSEGNAPRLSRLGGGEWNRVKNRVKEAVREIARELLVLYAARKTVHGFAFGPDTVWQKEFEAAFPFEETPDQLKAVEDVKADMERPSPMDRLLCGDVGYGKTEVALRAAFKAVMESKQVAVLVPTTILAQQHYNTFRERMADYPVRVEVLSRFRTAREQRNILQGLSQGTVDIVIGTHRMVQDDVRFKDLGLLIIDEEQRFGVAHKEKLKFFRKNVDVLTLSATPIPRTLHMSLVGLRDTSILETPPKDRYPIQTYVLDEDPVLFRESIYKEIGRGGQVFFVYNRIADMERITIWLQSLVPEAKIVMAHGQMREDDLEQVMLEFLDGSYDVLVCTTIIENGLDISNVNTLLVKEADMMGLSQLYQLKGRVGRSNRLAYAYFTFRRDKVLGESAEKRLAAIREFTELGSGFKIAMRDLEIRGAGNILGAEQHGHIAAVGFDLYCRLLEEAVREAKGEQTTPPLDITIELPVEAYIPDTYIPDGNQKVEIYKRIAGLATADDLADLADELTDRFGDAPAVVDNLLAAARVKILAGRLQVKKIILQGEFFHLFFSQEHSLTGANLVAVGQRYRNDIKFNNGSEGFEVKLRSVDRGGSSGMELLKELEKFLTELGSCSKPQALTEKQKT